MVFICLSVELTLLSRITLLIMFSYIVDIRSRFFSKYSTLTDRLISFFYSSSSEWIAIFV